MASEPMLSLEVGNRMSRATTSIIFIGKQSEYYRRKQGGLRMSTASGALPVLIDVSLVGRAHDDSQTLLTHRGADPNIDRNGRVSR